MIKKFREIENCIQLLSKVEPKQSVYCLTCCIGEDWFEKLQTVFSEAGLDPQLVAVTLAACPQGRKAIRIDQEGKMRFSRHGSHECINTQAFLDGLAEIMDYDG